MEKISLMKKIILDFPNQFKIGMERAKKTKVAKVPDKVLICGMGGSALPGEILKIWSQSYKIGLPITLRRDYGTGSGIDFKSLVILISYSGNTEETLSSYQESKRKKLSMAVITSGGKLAQLCQADQIPLALVPAGIPPRMALGYQFSALIKILANSKIIKDGLENIISLQKNLRPELSEEEGKDLAKKLFNKIPLIYSSAQREGLAKIWKIKFNENSKVPAFYNFFPELNHNEMVGFSQKFLNSNFHLIILQDSADSLPIKKRMRLTSQILRKKGIETSFVKIEGKDILYKIFNSILLADWTSYYLALKYKINPVPVEIVEKFKKQMKK